MKPRTTLLQPVQRWLLVALLVAMTLVSLPAATVWSDRLGSFALVPMAITVVYAIALPLVAAWLDGFKELRALFHPKAGVVRGLGSRERWAVALCALVGCAYAGSLLVVPSKDSSALGEALFIAGGFVFLAPSIAVDLLLHRRFGEFPPLAAVWKANVVAAATASAVALSGYAAVVATTGAGLVSSDWTSWAILLSLAVPALLAAAAIRRWHVVARWRERLEHEALRTQAAENARQMAEMELALLQAQIEPHFLYNTLASVQYLVERNAQGASYLLTQLIRYLQQSMPAMRSTRSTLRREFELVDAYLQIAKVRMGQRLRVEVELAEPLHDLPLPPLLVQTLVENALKHGAEPKVGNVSITVGARALEDGRVEIQVRDDGVGLGGAPTSGSGTGLRNLRLRLQTLYGDRAALHVESASGSGVIARLVLPLAAVGEADGVVSVRGATA